ncbi:helix-turn-helix domain-containing protein [Rufibacter roseolus]|uniref:helix-turn-helix domain-containing protein n=1 Tax=Rufibacter roseolus TaxID=2817375 RepID=UPI001B31430B|nr:helix-turn-helix domain-containing protein [Rufibacter roseolus]
MEVEIQRHNATAALQPFIAQYWSGTFRGKSMATLRQKVLPSGYIELVLHLPKARGTLKGKPPQPSSNAFSFFGFWTVPYVLQFRNEVETFGICFKPEALHAVFGVAAATLLNCPANLEEVLGASFSSFCRKLKQLKTFEERVNAADAYFLKQIPVTDAPPSFVQLAANLIRCQEGGTSVECLSHEVCIGMRQLEREFKNKLGLSPKTYMRISRLNKVLQLISLNPSLSLAQLSYLGGYADQAHFNRDFKQITGELPSVYLAEQENFLTF